VGTASPRISPQLVSVLVHLFFVFFVIRALSVNTRMPLAVSLPLAILTADGKGDQVNGYVLTVRHHRYGYLTIPPTHTSRTTSRSRRTPLSTHWILVITFKRQRTTALQLVHPQPYIHFTKYLRSLITSGFTFLLVAKPCVLPFSQVRACLSVIVFWNLNPTDTNLRRSSTANWTLSTCQSYHRYRCRGGQANLYKRGGARGALDGIDFYTRYASSLVFLCAAHSKPPLYPRRPDALLGNSPPM
jgi:hypothetical protein